MPFVLPMTETVALADRELTYFCPEVRFWLPILRRPVFAPVAIDCCAAARELWVFASAAALAAKNMRSILADRCRAEETEQDSEGRKPGNESCDVATEKRKKP